MSCKQLRGKILICWELWGFPGAMEVEIPTLSQSTREGRGTPWVCTDSACDCRLIGRVFDN